MSSRQPSGSPPKYRRSDALYIMNRRLMNTVVRMTSSAGVLEARSCAAATIEAPAKTRSDISIATAGGMPLATMATPVMTPKATTPGSTGAAARAPATRSFGAELLADAGLQLFAALVLASLADLLAAREALLARALARGGVLRLRAHLLHHAVLVLVAALAFAGGTCILVRVLRLRGVLLAGRRVLRLGAHLLQHAIAPRRAGLSLTCLLGLSVCGSRLGDALLAGLGVLRLRAIEMALLRIQRRCRGQQRGEKECLHGLSIRDDGPKNAQIPSCADTKGVTLCFLAELVQHRAGVGHLELARAFD